MSIEDSLSRIATALEQLVNKQSTPIPVATKKKVPEAAPVIKSGTHYPEVSTTVRHSLDDEGMKIEVFNVPVVAPIVESAPPVTVDVPFSDKAGLTTYIMAAYKKLGPISGSKIEGVIQSLGFNRVSDVEPASFRDVYIKVEELIAQSGDK